jgi:hypothetical protein
VAGVCLHPPTTYSHAALSTNPTLGLVFVNKEMAAINRRGKDSLVLRHYLTHMFVYHYLSRHVAGVCLHPPPTCSRAALSRNPTV